MTVRMLAEHIVSMLQGGVVFGALLFVLAMASHLWGGSTEYSVTPIEGRVRRRRGGNP